jgi:hypothetical protein
VKAITLAVASVLLSSGLFACSYPSKARTVRFADLGNPESTRIYNFMRDTGGHVETQKDWLMDEAAISTLAANEACVDLTVRSMSSIDLHPSQWNVKINGTAAAVTQSADPVTDSWTYSYQTMETTYERTTPRGTTTVEEPVTREGTAGSAERRARACAPVSAPTKLVVEVELPQPNGMSDWGQKFEWKLI